MGPSMQDTGVIAEKFVLSSVAWLAVGVALAIYNVLVYPGVPVHAKMVHAHVMLIGFVAMMIFGVAYRMLPLPPLLGTGGLYSLDLARYHLYLANLGLAGMVVFGLGMIFVKASAVRYGLVAFGTVEAAAMLLFVYNVYRTLQLKQSDLPFGGPPTGGPRGPGPGR